MICMSFKDCATTHFFLSNELRVIQITWAVMFGMHNCHQSAESLHTEKKAFLWLVLKQVLAYVFRSSMYSNKKVEEQIYSI